MCHIPAPLIYQSCRQYRMWTDAKENIVVNIDVSSVGLKQVYCDFTTDEGDWIVSYE